MAPTTTALELRGLSKSFGRVQAVRDVDLSVAAGEIVAVLGPNGAGRSTINELILGLVSPDAGRVAVFGADPCSAVQRRAARPGRGRCCRAVRCSTRARWSARSG